MVQGVGFRYFVQYAAERLNLAGYVRNLRDGRLEAYAIGTGEQLAAFRAALEKGPHGSRVSSVQEEPAPLEEIHKDDFVIANTV
jgi:acylphosphatase